MIRLDQNCPKRASLGTKKFNLQDLKLKRSNRASCGTKNVFSSHFYWQRDGVLLNATRREEKKTEAATSFDTFTVSINLPMLQVARLVLHCGRLQLELLSAFTSCFAGENTAPRARRRRGPVTELEFNFTVNSDSNFTVNNGQLD
jgi:hypothetical protein